MAEINNSTADARKAGVRRSKKLSTRVDLTPMVDLGFLLITFFIFSTTLSTPKVMQLVMPADSKDSSTLGLSNALTIFPLEQDRVFYYHGDLAQALAKGEYGFTNYAPVNGIGDIIRQKQQAMDLRIPHSRKELMLLIKPAANASYKSVIDVLDEVAINDVKKYAISDIVDGEKVFLLNQHVKL